MGRSPLWELDFLIPAISVDDWLGGCAAAAQAAPPNRKLGRRPAQTPSQNTISAWTSPELNPKPHNLQSRNPESRHSA